MKTKIWLWIVGVIVLFGIIISFLPNNSPSNSASVKIIGSAIQEGNNEETITEKPEPIAPANQDNPKETITKNPEPEPIEQEEPTKGYFLVTRVIDGDTIEIEGGERVRLICINTPETGEQGYKEAKDFLIDSILNKEIKLIKDVTEKDRYERLLRYIYLEDGTFVNELIVRLGYGVAYPYGQDTQLCPLIESAERLAERDGLGVWDTEQEPIENDSEYVCDTNVYNCGDFSTHAEAQEVFELCGGIDNDIHKLDGDYDGIACEELL